MHTAELFDELLSIVEDDDVNPAGVTLAQAGVSVSQLPGRTPWSTYYAVFRFGGSLQALDSGTPADLCVQSRKLLEVFGAAYRKGENRANNGAAAVGGA